jgi:hypothetical protein
VNFNNGGSETKLIFTIRIYLRRFGQRFTVVYGPRKWQFLVFKTLFFAIHAQETPKSIARKRLKIGPKKILGD